jgi:hypothetical protein
MKDLPLLSGFTPGVGFTINATEQPVPIHRAVEMALQILSSASVFAGWRPSEEQRRALTDVLATARDKPAAA